MNYSPDVTDRQHREIQADNKPSMYFAMRTCTGSCRQRRSVGQFDAGSTVCIRCARRAPKAGGDQ